MDKELDKKVITDLLGWHFNKSSFEQYEPSTYSKNGITQAGGNFSPSSRIEDSFKAVDAIHELDPTITFVLQKNYIGSHGASLIWSATFYAHMGHGEVLTYSQVVAETPAEAICKAALQTKDEINKMQSAT